MADVKANVIPIYFVPDESWSMQPVVHELNSGLTSLLDAMHEETLAAAMIRFSIIGFSDNAIEHLRLTDLRSIESLPKLSANNGTSYRAAFVDLRQRIEADVAELRTADLGVRRPAIFFPSDGVPNNEDWRSALLDLRSEDFKFRPNIIAFGIGEANPEVIREVASSDDHAFIAAKGTDTGTALVNFFEALTRSVVSSGQQLAQGSNTVPVEKPEGFELAIDMLPE